MSSMQKRDRTPWQIGKRSVQRLVSAFGYQIVRRKVVELDGYPVEFDDDDKSIFDYVLRNELTMVGRERLIATLLACKHVCQAEVEGDFVECGVWRGGNSII